MGRDASSFFLIYEFSIHSPVQFFSGLIEQMIFFPTMHKMAPMAATGTTETTVIPEKVV